MTRLDLRGTPPWMDHAACIGKPTHWWYPRPGQHAHRAHAICEKCPVQSACLEWAVVHIEDWGIWGGTSERERRRLRRRAGMRRCARCDAVFHLGGVRFAQLCAACRGRELTTTTERTSA